MHVGMLWFDNDERRDLSARLTRAARHYEAKYGVRPTLCYVNPLMLPEGDTLIAGLEVRASNTVLPHHFWLGQHEESEQRSAA